MVLWIIRINTEGSLNDILQCFDKFTVQNLRHFSSYIAETYIILFSFFPGSMIYLQLIHSGLTRVSSILFLLFEIKRVLVYNSTIFYFTDLFLLYIFIQNAYADRKNYKRKKANKLCLKGQIVIDSHSFLEYWQNRLIDVDRDSTLSIQYQCFYYIFFSTLWDIIFLCQYLHYNLVIFTTIIA